MPAFLVHGVPDTHREWEPLRAQLSRADIVAPDLPGFGCGVPPGFEPTKDNYVDWLIGQIEAIGEPVDLVGHDWGSLLVQRIVSVRPDLIRTWAAGGGPVDREYVWHQMAQQWQTPGVGEEVVKMMTPDTMRMAMAPELGEHCAGVMADHVDETMHACILGLYRSAIGVGAEWADAVDRITKPGLVLWGRDDPYVGAEFAERLAKRTGARLVIFDDTAHWWPVTRAADAARELERHWASV